MFEKRINTIADVEPRVRETNMWMVRKGNGYYLGDDFVAPSPEDNAGFERAYKFTENMKGISEVIPFSRIALVTYYDGRYVPTEHAGLGVDVPVRGSWAERRRLDQDQELSRFRYYNLDELTTDDRADANLCKMAVVRAIYEVANGEGDDASAKKFQAMEEAAEAYRKEVEEKESLEAQIQEEMRRIEPRLQKLRQTKEKMMDRWQSNAKMRPQGLIRILTKYSELEKEARPTAIANLGLPSDPMKDGEKQS